MSKRYNDNKKMPKPKENQQGILKMYAFFPENVAEGLGSRREHWSYVFLYDNIYIFSGSRKGTIGT